MKRLPLIPLLFLAALPVWEQSMAHVTPPDIADDDVPTQTFPAGRPRPSMSNRGDTAWRFADYRTAPPTDCDDATGMPTAPVDGARQIDSAAVVNAPIHGWMTGGWCSEVGNIAGQGGAGYYWSANEYSATSGCRIYVQSARSYFGQNGDKSLGDTLRCVQDEN